MLMLLLFFNHRVMGGSVAVAISGHGAQRFSVFLLSEIGYGMEACLRGANNSRADVGVGDGHLPGKRRQPQVFSRFPKTMKLKLKR